MSLANVTGRRLGERGIVFTFYSYKGGAGPWPWPTRPRCSPSGTAKSLS